MNALSRFTKGLLAFLLLTLCFCQAYSRDDKFVLGLTLAPGVSWLKPTGSSISNGVAGFGMLYGLNIEYYFKEHNYGISTGLFGSINNGGLNGRDTFSRLNSGRAVKETYNTNNVVLPLYLKLKTNPFKKKFILFAEVGFQLVFNVSARASYSSPLPGPSAGGALVTVDKENVLRGGNAVQSLIPGFLYSIFDFRLSAGGGLEYRIHGNTVLIFAVHYNNGFVPVVNDKAVNPKHDPTLARNVLLTVGAMF